MRWVLPFLVIEKAVCSNPPDNVERVIAPQKYHNHPYEIAQKHQQVISKVTTDGKVVMRHAESVIPAALNVSNFKPMRLQIYPLDVIGHDSAYGDLDQEIRDVVEISVSHAASYFQQALKVYPVNGSLVAKERKCYEVDIPEEHRTNGVPNTDFVVYYSAAQTDFCGGAVAYATHCQQDQWGRPTHGYINICPSRVFSRLGHLFMLHIIEKAGGDLKVLASSSSLTLESLVDNYFQDAAKRFGVSSADIKNYINGIGLDNIKRLMTLYTREQYEHKKKQETSSLMKVSLHEVMHALVWNSALFPLYRDRTTGLPYLQSGRITGRKWSYDTNTDTAAKCPSCTCAIGNENGTICPRVDANGTTLPYPTDCTLQCGGDDRCNECRVSSAMNVKNNTGWEFEHALGVVAHVDDGSGTSICPCPFNTLSYDNVSAAWQLSADFPWRVEDLETCLFQGCDFGGQWDSVQCPSKKCNLQVITPMVKLKAQEHFNCSTLQGAALENYLGSPSVFLQSHLEARHFVSDLMAAVLADDMFTPTISAVALALFDDSGWYEVNYSYATHMIKDVHFGYQQGCDFPETSCEEMHTTPDNSYARFCTMETLFSSCRYYNCSVAFFVDQSKWLQCGAPNSFLVKYADGCRIRTVNIVAEIDGVRVDATCNEELMNGFYLNVNYNGQVFGSESNAKCFISDINNVINGDALSDPSKQARCLKTECSGNGSSYTIYFQAGNISVPIGNCSAKDQVIEVPVTNRSSVPEFRPGHDNLTSSVTCQDPQTICNPKYVDSSGLVFGDGGMTVDDLPDCNCTNAYVPKPAPKGGSDSDSLNAVFANFNLNYNLAAIVSYYAEKFTMIGPLYLLFLLIPFYFVPR